MSPNAGLYMHIAHVSDTSATLRMRRSIISRPTHFHCCPAYDRAMLSRYSRCSPLLPILGQLRSAKQLNVRLISSSATLRTQRRSEAKQSEPEPGIPPEERLKHLKSAERKWVFGGVFLNLRNVILLIWFRVAVFAGVSMLVGYFALRRTFSGMKTATKNRPQTEC